LTDKISHVFNPVPKMAIRVLFLAILNGSLRAVLPLLANANNYPYPLAP
jgi:hypothetical protein